MAWLEGRVVAVRHWTSRLFSVQFEAPLAPFVAGQFAKVGLPDEKSPGEEMVGRPYSLVNPPSGRPHEIYAIEVEGGPLSPRLKALRADDALWVQASANGFFSVSEVPSAKNLWCFATGTGLGPFLSILRDGKVWEKFESVALLHGVRYAEELTYRDEIASLQSEYGQRLRYQPLVSREGCEVALRGRITDFVSNGVLENKVGLPLDASSHSMLCGNPSMVNEVTALLELRGLKKHRRKTPGHYTTETYW